MSKIETAFAMASRHLRNFAADQGGATAVEYALVASGVAVAVAATVFSLGSGVKNMFTKVDSAF